MARETEALFARAEAAAAEAKRLVEINWDWQHRTYGAVRRMYLRAVFEPLGRRITYPHDVRKQPRPPSRPLPGQDDGQDRP